MRESGKPMAAHRSNVSNDGLEHDDQLWLQIVSCRNLAPEFSATLHMVGRRNKQIHNAKRSGEIYKGRWRVGMVRLNKERVGAAPI